MYGSHLSIAGSMVNALNEGEALGLDCVQVFTKNQQQWKAKPLDPTMVAEWHVRVRELGWDKGGPDGRGGIVSHASYLINLASVNSELWSKSVDLMTDEIERCEALAIPYLVHHPGSHVGGELSVGLDNIVRAYGELFRRTKGMRVVSCLEGTVGAGSTIGGPFEHLADLRTRIADVTGEPRRIGICLDTCHLHAAGHDLSTRESAAAVLAAFDAACGVDTLRVMHVNDSKGKVGSKLDRHDHIGHGWIGGGATPHKGDGTYSAAKLRRSGFAEFMNHPRVRAVPKILETPKGDRTTPSGRSTPWDSVNLARLRGLDESARSGSPVE